MDEMDVVETTVDTPVIYPKRKEADDLARQKAISIESFPVQGCPACNGVGYLGKFHNKKVIPCLCVFNDPKTWMIAAYVQRNSPRHIKDKFLTVLKDAIGRAIVNVLEGKGEEE